MCLELLLNLFVGVCKNQRGLSQLDVWQMTGIGEQRLNNID